MKKQISKIDVIAISLLYQKQYSNKDMLLFDEYLEYRKSIKDSLEMMNVPYLTTIKENDFSLYDITTNQDKMVIKLKENIDVKIAWLRHVYSLPIPTLIASLTDDALSTIGICPNKEQLKKTYQKEYTLTRKGNFNV